MQKHQQTCFKSKTTVTIPSLKHLRLEPCHLLCLLRQLWAWTETPFSHPDTDWETEDATLFTNHQEYFGCNLSIYISFSHFWQTSFESTFKRWLYGFINFKSIEYIHTSLNSERINTTMLKWQEDHFTVWESVTVEAKLQLRYVRFGDSEHHGTIMKGKDILLAPHLLLISFLATLIVPTAETREPSVSGPVT